ncbi:DDB1- and CUL4-associated factor 4 [Marchantia polymorpha subsp. ruderalis]|uniref:Uncharacterized protein n=2 Tax=Marchantia polymorpha TaxID=3197 RepID=A0AAF6AQS8_MARPO|nr:hypothetical protein MARPO_0033s0026 [Marchantia polymorpha]BBM98798.1 hypothetical protein Mp_1g16340 [Marchantia polymorpha subsp. ruderalis]|eukprot:PTQ41605.1 hypothetical protein MARPO_0033s0026 [Marchantia polymorpha]
MGSKRPPPDLPGMYFDVERNRYFPLKSRMSTNEDSRMKSAAEQLRQDEESARSAREDAILYKRRIPKTAFSAMEKSEDGNAILRLLYQRELSGHNWRKRAGANCSVFERQILESYTGHMNSSRVQPPKIWTYLSVHCDGGIEQCRLDIQTASGQVEVDAMVVGGFNEVQTLQVCGPEDISIWGDGSFMSQNNPRIFESYSVKKSAILRPVFVKLPFTSMITSVKKFMDSEHENDEDIRHSTQNVILTTLGNGGEGGSIYLMRDGQDVLSERSRPFSGPLRVQINSDIYTAECSPRRKQVSLGLKAGAAILDIERSEVYRTFIAKSSVLAQQFDNSGNLLLCGYRNGMIIPYDLRLPPPSTSQTRKRNTRSRQSPHYEGMQMRSTVCSMSLLRSNEFYLIASAMDGQIWQWDRRISGRGPVQTYEGHVNTHSLLQVRLDPSERLLASGGTDGALRIWSVKSSRLLHVERKLSCVPKRICWNTSHCTSNEGGWDYFEEPCFKDDSPWALWTGSTKLLHIRGGHGD